LNAPKSTATIYGYENEALMIFELPCGAFKAKAENPELAKVTVYGDVMTIPEIIEQLKKIVPSEKFNWEVFHFRDNIFRGKLPSKQEVQRLKNFGTYICTDRESCLTFLPLVIFGEASIHATRSLGSCFRLAIGY
jgi:hypothetical protein